MTDYASLVARLRDYSPENRQHVVHESATAIEALRASHEQRDKESLCALMAERDALRAERDELKRCLDGGFDCAAERIALRADAMRYRWLADRYFGADFRWGDPVDSIPVLVFKLDADCRVYGSCDMTVDAAMAAPPVAGPTEP